MHRMEKVFKMIIESTEDEESNLSINKEKTLASAIPLKKEDLQINNSLINFCIKCFKGQFHLEIEGKTKPMLKCNSCSFKVSIYI
jgi:rRNA maturation endonuclease Nob1